MSIENMQYEFKRKLNKADSQKYKNLRIQEIDMILNEACGIFIKTIAQPRIANAYGFEKNTRTINDIRTLVIEGKEIVPVLLDNVSYRIGLPEDYQFLASSFCLGNKGKCEDSLDMISVDHDINVKNNTYYKPSFEWRETNYRFYDGGIRLFTDGTFTIKKVYLDYIRRPKYMHFAKGVAGGKYNLPDGTTLTGKQDCELPIGVHSEIVDIAVLMTTGELQMPDYQIKMAKINGNN